MITWSPTDARLEVLKKSLESIERCTHRPHILVVVDNGPESQTDWLKTQNIDKHIINEVNIGIGGSRNIGAESTDTEYIAFIDNDITVFDGWLNGCVDVLKKYPDRKLISTPRKSSPMKYRKYFRGNLDGYELWSRASGQALVMKRSAWKEIGWSERSTPGGIFCNAARKLGYKFIRKDDWKAKHLCKKPSYNYRHKLENGIWRAK